VNLQAGDLTYSNSTTLPFTLKNAQLVNGSLSVTVGGELLAQNVELQSNSAGYQITLQAGGDLIVDRVAAGYFAATAEDAAELWTQLGRTGTPQFTSASNVTLLATGQIRSAEPVDTAVDVIASQLTMRAGTGIGGLQIAVNELLEATTTSGEIRLRDLDGAAEVNPGILITKAITNNGSITISSANRLRVEQVSASGAGANIDLSNDQDALTVALTAGIATAISATGGVRLSTPADLTLDGQVTAGTYASFLAGGDFTPPQAGMNVSVSGALVFDIGGSLKLNGLLEATDFTFVSQGGNLSSTATIRGQGGVTVDEIALEAWGNRVVSGPAAGKYQFRSEANGQLYYATQGNFLSLLAAGGTPALFSIQGGQLVDVSGSAASLRVIPATISALQAVAEETGLYRMVGANGHVYFRSREATPTY